MSIRSARLKRLFKAFELPRPATASAFACLAAFGLLKELSFMLMVGWREIRFVLIASATASASFAFAEAPSNPGNFQASKGIGTATGIS